MPSKVENHWYRIGSSDEYSEFTFNPVRSKKQGQYVPGNMSGSRGTGVASGQYAFGSPTPEPGEFDTGAERERVPVPRPSNPAKVYGGHEEVYRFQHAAITLMRLAEGAKEGYAGDTAWNLKFNLVGFRPDGKSYEQVEADIAKAIEDWKICRQVHPMNILLSRWGYDGIEYVGEAEKYGNSGTFGNVRFPPIDDAGCLLCMEPVSDRYMRLNEECKKLITESKKKLCGMMNRAVGDEVVAGGEYLQMAELAEGSDSEKLLGIAMDEEKHKEVIREIISRVCR